MISEFVEYVKQAWKNKPNVSSPLNADRLNHMEAGIENNSKKIKETVTAVNELTEKVLTLKASCTVSEKKLTVSIPLEGKSGLLLVQGNHLLQSFTVLVLVCYNAKLIEWTNANLYVNSNCTISGNANTSIKIEISTDQIVGTETFEVTACMLH